VFLVAGGGGGGGPPPAAKPSKGGRKKPEKKASAKAQIRGIERLLKREMPPDVRKQHEERLQALREGIEDRKHSELERKMSKKYHMVKFFERKKITKNVRRVEKSIQEASSAKEKAALQREHAKWLEDLEYVENFPRDQPYMSVLKTPDRERVDKMRLVIKKLMQTSATQKAEQRRKDALGSEDEDDGAAEDDDDFFVDADDEEEDARRGHERNGKGLGASKEADAEEQSSSKAETKKKRDKKLPDRNRKAKKKS